MCRIGLKKHYSFGHVSKLKGPDRSIIWNWFNFYKTNGKVGLLPRQNQSYSIDFKLKILNSISSNSLSLWETCLEFNIPDAAIIVKWKNDFANFGVEGLKSEMFYTQKFKSIEELKHEIKQYINYNNTERIKSNLNKKSPIKYWTHYYQNYL